MNIFITGVSSGLGKALVEQHLEQGNSVYGVSRRPPDKALAGMHYQAADLSQLDNIEASLQALQLPKQLHRVYLNAGIIGRLSQIIETQQTEIDRLMTVNVWANKVILDHLLPRHEISQVIGISSGASISGHKGWSGYSLSKSTLNMLLRLYANEFEKTHFISLAPGLVTTSMLNGLLENESPEEFPSMARLQASHKQTPLEAAKNIIGENEKVLARESGSYADLRDFL